MGVKRQSRILWAVASVAAAATCSVPLRADLASSSPFLPANAAAAGGQAGPAGPVELRGIMATSSGFAYCIYDTAKKTSAWVGLNEAGNDFVVKAADPTKESVTVDFQGRSLKLVLRTAKVASVGPPGARPATAVSSSVVVNPSMADEQRRLDAVAEEVRRRRAERMRALNAASTPPAGTPPATPSVAPSR
jgi:hypothetical protein